MKIAAILLILLVAGCGGSSGENNHGFGFGFDVQGVTGMRVRYDPAEVKQGFAQTPVHVLEAAYMEVQKCTGLTAPAPFVIFVPRDALGDELGGFYFTDPPLITIKGLFIFRHEVVHYLLDQATGNLDAAHASPLFAKCS